MNQLIESQELDVHTATVKEVFGTTLATRDQRRAAKAINFGIIYGMPSAPALNNFQEKSSGNP